MHRRWMPRWLVLVALIALLSVASEEVENVPSGEVSDSAVATSNGNGNEKTRSFVAATRGSAHALTLTTFLTDAAHLHYAVLPAGHSALDAAAIKTAAAQCRVDISEADGGASRGDSAATRRLPGTSNAVQKAQSVDAVAAETVTVAKAQKVESAVDNLLPNTSYDVYFVAEVIGSNGVFGPVQSVLQSWTHPEPPAIDISFVGPANASSDMVLVNSTLSTPGRAYFALVPSGSDDANVVKISPEHLVMNRTSDVETPGSHFTLYSIPLGNNGSYAFQEVMGSLTPATLYDVFVMTEAPGNGQVRSEVTRHPNPVRTHALAPEVATLKCSPVNASASALDVRFKLEVDQADIDRANLDTLPFFKYDLHYEVIALSDNAASKKQATVTSSAASTGTGATRSTDDISALKNTTIRGVFSMPNFTSVEDFHAGLRSTHHANITGLQSGTLYKVKLRAETAGSNGLFGLRELTAQAKTHEEAPKIVAAAVQATNKSVNSLTLTVDLARSRGNIHYVLTGGSGFSNNLRSVFQQATNVENLRCLLHERSRDFNENDVVTGSFKFSSEEIVSTSPPKLNPNPRSRPHAGTTPGNSPEESTEEAFRQEFEITGLTDATSYSIALLPETTKSFGLFGRAFSTLLEASTNENASAVELRSAKPRHGNISATQLEVSMTKPQDVLFMCLDPVSLTSEATEDADDATTMSSDSCREVEDRESFELSRGASNLFTFTVGNLSEDTEYRVSLYAENVRRNGVLSDRSEELAVRTHKRAPHIVETSAQPTAATTSQVEAQVTVEPDSPCIVHYVVRETPDSTDTEERKPVDAATIVEFSSESSRDNRPQFQHRLPPSSSSSFVKAGNVFAEHDTTTDFAVQGLIANTTYEVFVVTETSCDGNSSGVLGEPATFNVTTHAIAPKIVLATVDPVPGSTDSVMISANLSHPGMLHYFLSDVDFADPAIISHGDGKHMPHELRGQLQVLEEHILMEVINGTNDTRPTEPLTFVHNTTVGGLKSGRTYHVSLTTETYGSDGVFGEFPPPVLVNTHLGPPVIIPETLSVHAVDGSSSALALDFQLDRFGDVHYALFFRGLVPDRSRQFEEAQDALQKSESKVSTAAEDTKDGENETIAIWPPLVSTFDLTELNGSMLKAAELEELGVGVWVNDTISVSREDVTRGKITHKEIDKLPANALFDVCLVSETAASGGILGWPSNGSASACHRVATHADYTNQSKLLDEISVHALGGRTDGVRINLNVSKLLDAPPTTDTDGTILDRFAQAAGRVPYFVLLDSKAKSGRDVGVFTSHRGEVTSAFKEASPGRGDGVVAAGMLANITAENGTALRIEQDVFGLEANHEYLLYFAYETSDSNGVFTRVNPHKHRSNDSRFENDGIPVTTFEAAPRIPKAKAQPSFGHTTRITVKFDIACDSCESALVHLLVFPDDCKFPHSVADTLRLDQLSTSKSNTTVSASPADEYNENHCKVPLVQKRVEFAMPERQHSRNDLQEELGDDHVLTPNTSYIVLVATETEGSQGVLSNKFEEPLRVRTHAPAPKFTELRMEPRTGSTTELLLKFALDRPGEVHYMLGASDNAEFNVTSPHNISSKGLANDRHGRARDFHDYRLEVVRMRRSVTYSDGEHVELLDYLLPGTSYSLFIVSEALPADHGVYGSIQEVKEVSTFANAPILLAHTAYPTPGTTKTLTVGFRMDAPGIVYFSVVAVKPWDLTHHVASGSDRYGNRLALHDELVAQKRLDVDEESMELESDSGWREQILDVPQTGLNYTVHLVTETKGSGGIYGIVATHAGVRAHSEAPELVNVSVNPTDARVDALSVNVTLSDRGHVHYIALPSGRGSASPSDDFSQQSTELSVLASGSVDVNETAGGTQETSFRITGLTEGTSYDLYFRTETFESFGVFGAWTHQAVTTRTHGLPPDVLPEALECKVTPSCEERGRETCSRKANMCGKCLDGYTTTTDEELPETNESCVKLEPATEDKRGPTIKINGIKRNPNLHLSEVEPEHKEEQEQELPPEVELLEPEQQHFEHESLQQDTMNLITEDVEIMQEPVQEPMQDAATVQDIGPEELSEPVVMVQEMQEEPMQQPELEPAQQQPPVEQDSPAMPDQGIPDVDSDALDQYQVTSEHEPIPEPRERAGCPLNAQATASGLCECIPGYEVDEDGTSCVLLRMETAGEAAATATSTAFDLLNARHQIPGHSA
ncbi:hypothetical protein PF002_g14901 [Phytophthora fragariae]|uniref:Fibronectin type-III domain-containing protein n=2 Tax=Phytophthora fragariae TaxID=53985 RepID=A0A6A3U0P9_9STRA|nr:hypothetical protein PF003_g21530 [Phytophthora fragariae]KAE8935288.1 hypothetical protein PF009_g14759 [Phytophthora fragariae]KAE9144740.1 hypothetical protein PF006_g10355 [Phytophthora fragariae]KAE9223690.1 hypothetical protein PF002_g14901 [Phytophthora fragariae]